MLGYLDSDLALKAQQLQARYVHGKDLWGLLREAAKSRPPEAAPQNGAKKRTCSVNLGGHCATENAVSFANQMRFLSSGMSPGKRRRRNVPSNALGNNGRLP